MELDNVNRLVEIGTAEEANRYLEIGWVCLNVIQIRNSDEAYVKYVLAWRDDSEPKFPKSKWNLPTIKL